MAQTLSSYGAKFSLKDASGCLLWFPFILTLLIYLLKYDKSLKAIISNNLEKLLEKENISQEIPL